MEATTKTSPETAQVMPVKQAAERLKESSAP
jgi:hypothetical protein